jgi:hypothetical protein
VQFLPRQPLGCWGNEITLIYRVKWLPFGVVLFVVVLCGQVFKSKRWMPWHLEPKKDVEICDKPRGADNRAVIRGSPNGETPPGGLTDLVTPA